MTDFEPATGRAPLHQSEPMIGEPILASESPGPVPSRAGHEPGSPQTSAQHAESSLAIMVFVLGLGGLFAFPPLAPFAWYFGRQELEGIDAGRRAGQHRGLALAGKIMGMIGSAILALIVLLLIVAVVLALVSLS